MRRWLAALSVSLVTALLSLVMTVGISGASPSSLSGELLGGSAMPTGWNVAHSSSRTDVGCLHALLQRKVLHPTGYAKIGYEERRTLQAFVEALATYANTGDAYKRIVALIDGCGRVDTHSGGKTTSIIAERVPFAHYGNASAAFSIRVVIQGITFRDDMLVIRKGGVIMGIEEGGFPQVDVHQFETFVTQALARLSTR